MTSALANRRRRFLPLAISALVGCTPLDDADDVFGSRGGGGRAAAGGGTAGEHGATGGDASAGSGGAPGDAGTGGAAGILDGSGGAGGRGEESGGAGGDAGEGADAGCTDPHGFQALGCYRCVPEDIVTLENACSPTTCAPFVGSRLTKLPLSKVLPPLPVASGGSGGSSGAAGSAGNGGAAGSSGGGGTGGTPPGTPCESLSAKARLVYVTGSSAVRPFLQQIAQQTAGGGVIVVYTSTGSCIGVDAIVNGTPMTTGPSPAPAASAIYWDSSSSAGSACDLPHGGVPADLGISDVFAQSCTGFELTALDTLHVRDAHGPVQTMGFVVPTNSPYSEISAQAAYFVFGFGADGGVLGTDGATAAWSDEAFLYRRTASSGTQTLLAAAIGVPPALWKGKANGSSDAVATGIQAAAGARDAAEKAIGILAADYIDSRNLRAQIRMLAFQDSQQGCAVFPDSTATAKDKRNVRDGHYPLWGPLHLLHRVDALGNPLNPANRTAIGEIVGYLSGTRALPNGVKLIDVFAQSGLVPECAMRVTRAQDGGNITPRTPESPCSCLFEARATGHTTCGRCATQGDCDPGSTCSQGYCER